LFAKKLGNEELYQDALRHMVAYVNVFNHWKGLVDCFKTSENQIHNFFKPQLKQLESTLEKLTKKPHKLQLEPVKMMHNTRFYRYAVTRFIDAEEFKKLERAHNLAHSMLGEFVVNELYGEKVTSSESGLEAEEAG
jgi:hypothetical protein